LNNTFGSAIFFRREPGIANQADFHSLYLSKAGLSCGYQLDRVEPERQTRYQAEEAADCLYINFFNGKNIRHFFSRSTDLKNTIRRPLLAE